MQTYFLYGLHAATSLRFVLRTRGCPSIVSSHIISFMHPTASVVFVSSKKSTVMISFPNFLQFDLARDSAFLTLFNISFFVVPPWT